MVDRGEGAVGVLNRLIVVLFILPALWACGSNLDDASSLAARKRLAPQIVNAGPFDLLAFAPASFTPGMPLTVYVEGDGFAWVTSTRLSDDPTPRRPVALELAVADPAPNVVYVARPCQYVKGTQRRNCHPAYWSSARFAEEVVAATDRVVEHFRSVANASAVRLTGYSGGGALAVLVAARRADVQRVVTVAGVVDTEAWTSLDGTTPLFHSLNPAQVAERVAGIPQIHFVGADDKVVPAAVARSFADRFPPDRRPPVTIVPRQGHECCWAEVWPALLARTP